MSPTRSICTACLRALRISSARTTRLPRPLPFSARRHLSTTRPATRTPLSLLSTPRHTNPSVPRAFSSTARTNRVLLNPRNDDDGNPMTVEITPRAATRLAQIAAKEQNPDLVLRVSVESGGCHGFQYLMSLTDMKSISRDEDTVFESDYVPKGQDAPGEGEGRSDSSRGGGGGGVGGGGGAKVVMDEPSLELLKGSKVDYTMELIGSQFKIVDNPAATSSCGCGTSFDVKV